MHHPSAGVDTCRAGPLQCGRGIVAWFLRLGQLLLVLLCFGYCFVALRSSRASGGVSKGSCRSLSFFKLCSTPENEARIGSPPRRWRASRSVFFCVPVESTGMSLVERDANGEVLELPTVARHPG